MDLPQIPARHPELLELEERRRTIRAQRTEIEAELRRVQLELSRLATGDDADDIAEQLADGRLAEISGENLPQQRDVLRSRLDLVIRGEQKLNQRLVRERERHNNQIVKAFRPAHKLAVQRLAKALDELVAANAAEAEVRQACPVRLVNMNVPNIGGFTVNDAGPARYWREHATRLGFFEPDPEPKPEPKASGLGRLVPRRARGNGAAEPAPLVAKAD